MVAMGADRLLSLGRAVSLRSREFGAAAMVRLRVTISALAAADPPVGNGAESWRADVMSVLLLLSRRRAPRVPGVPKKVVCGAKRRRAEAGRRKGVFSERGGRLIQVSNVLYCQMPCAVVAALLMMAIAPRAREGELSSSVGALLSR